MGRFQKLSLLAFFWANQFAVTYSLPSDATTDHKPKWIIGQAVTTTSGLIVGHSSPNHTDVSEYLGIPFGEDTGVAGRRFKNPVPYRRRNDTLFNAAEFSPACPQVLGPAIPLIESAMGVSMTPASMGEDCLTLNIWTAPQHGERRKAVMVFLYGGAFTLGASSLPVYHGAALARAQDVVVVTLNYRVDVFGFPGAAAADMVNPGLMDQRLAVQWVRDNVAAFGGNPAEITLFGESAGAISAHWYSYAWRRDPIARGFILQSGSAFGNFKGLSRPWTADAGLWNQFAEHLGCPAGVLSSSNATYDCMAKVPMDTVLGMLQIFGSFVPWRDNLTVFEDYWALERRLAGHSLPRLAYLIGSNHNESLLFSRLVSQLPTSNDSAVAAASHAHDLDRGFRCGAADSAYARAQSHRYLFAGNLPGSGVGASHGDELRAVFGTGEPRDPLTGLFQRVWGTFAKEGTKGLNGLGWPMYGRGKEDTSLVRIAPDGQPYVDFVDPDIYDREFCRPSGERFMLK